jgi:hypothetical protein
MCWDNGMEDFDLTAADLEIHLMGVIAFWGDGRIRRQELKLLEDYYSKNSENLNLVPLTDPLDPSLSKKEYILGLFDFLKSEEVRISEEGIDLPKEFIKLNKKKLKKEGLSDKEKVFVFLLNELGSVYDSEFSEYNANLKKSKNKSEITKVHNRNHRMHELQKMLIGIARADGSIDKDEKNLINLAKHETHVSKWVWITLIIIILFVIGKCSQ